MRSDTSDGLLVKCHSPEMSGKFDAKSGDVSLEQALNNN